MNTEIDRQIKNIRKRLFELENLLKKFEGKSASDADVYSEMVNDLVMESENLASDSRALALNSYTASQNFMMRQIADTQGITVENRDGIIEIKLPFLLPKKKHRDTRFLCEPLFFTLYSAALENDFKIKERAVVCFVHVYECARKNVSPRDYDNVEAKKILDTVALFCLTDDGAEYCDIYHTMEYGIENKTKILVMPERRFLVWKSDHIKQAKTPSETCLQNLKKSTI